MDCENHPRWATSCSENPWLELAWRLLLFLRLPPSLVGRDRYGSRWRSEPSSTCASLPTASGSRTLVRRLRVEKNEHVGPRCTWFRRREAKPRRLTYATRIFNRPLPASRAAVVPRREAPHVPRFRFRSPAGDGDGRRRRGAVAIDFVADGRRALRMVEGLDVASPTWPRSRSPRRKPAKNRRRRSSSDAGKPGRPTRLFVQDVPSGALPRTSVPARALRFGLRLVPRRQESLVYSASAAGEYLENWRSRLYTISADGGEPLVLVGRDGMNSEPRYSPDGRLRRLHFDRRCRSDDLLPGTSRRELRGRRASSADGRRHLGARGPWEPSSRSLLFVPNEATGRGGERMFEQPVFRVDLEGKTEVVSYGCRRGFFPERRARTGAALAFRSVGPRDAGDVAAMDLKIGHVANAHPREPASSRTSTSDRSKS